MTARRAAHHRLALGPILLGLLVAAAAPSACSWKSPATDSILPGGSASPTAPATPAASPTDPNQATYEAIQGQVEGIRGLAPKSALTPTLVDEQGVRDYMEHAFETQIDHDALAATGRMFQHLGLLPEGASLEQLELDLESGQIIGFYDTTTKQLYLLSQSGGVGVMQRWTFAHEYTHALQDQTFGLDKLAIDAPEESDRDLARTAVAEGDAMLVTNAWTQQHLSLIDQVNLLISGLGDPSSGQLEAAPAILRANLMFPYLEGEAFVQWVYDQGGWAAVDALYAKPPNSTSQILHPELYASGVEPIAVSLPAVPASLGSGWKLSLQDTMGEMQLRVWFEGESPSTAGRTAASDAVWYWGGDRIGLYEGPNDAWAVVLRTTWRTASGRVAFETAARAKMGDLAGPTAVCADGRDVAFYVASDVTTLQAFAPCRPQL